MTESDSVRMDALYAMARQCRIDGLHPTLRGAALDGIEAEIAKQGCAIDWLRAAVHPDNVMSFACAGWWVVMVRDRHTTGWRGASGADENEAAASAIARHLPYAGMLPNP